MAAACALAMNGGSIIFIICSSKKSTDFSELLFHEK